MQTLEDLIATAQGYRPTRPYDAESMFGTEYEGDAFDVETGTDSHDAMAHIVDCDFDAAMDQLAIAEYQTALIDADWL